MLKDYAEKSQAEAKPNKKVSPGLLNWSSAGSFSVGSSHTPKTRSATGVAFLVPEATPGPKPYSPVSG